MASSSDSSSASRSHSVSLACAVLTPTRSAALTRGGAAAPGVGTDVAEADSGDPEATVPRPQLTAELGCTLTGPPEGSTAETVNSSVVHATPNVRDSACVAVDVDVPGPRSRGRSDTVSPTVRTLPSSAWRRVASEMEPVARADPVTVTVLAP